MWDEFQLQWAAVTRHFLLNIQYWNPLLQSTAENVLTSLKCCSYFSHLVTICDHSLRTHI